VDGDGRHYLIETKGQETKGRENIDVAHKDRAAAIWCAARPGWEPARGEGP
jgi:hypothetical protein